MDWIKNLVPLIGTALGGPLGGAAASFVAEKLGLPQNTIEAVTEALNAGTLSPEQVSNLKLAELDFKKFLETNKIDILKLEVENTKSARDMQISTRSKTPDVLAIIIVTGFFAILTSMMLGVLNIADNQSLLILLGALSAGFGSVLNFFYGSSSGSQQKDALLAKAPSIDSNK